MPIDTQMVCTSEPFCLCVGKPNPWDECDCTGNVIGCRRDLCEACGAPLVEIYTETGERVAA